MKFKLLNLEFNREYSRGTFFAYCFVIQQNCLTLHTLLCLCTHKCGYRVINYLFSSSSVYE